MKNIKTTVVNKHHNISYDVYIGRGSKWGNPFTIGQHGNREEVIEKYREWIMTQPKLLADLYELRGKVLCCFCKPQSCHGDILVELVNNLKILECSSKGDKRFSAFYARVKMWGNYNSIENHYQLCKRFGNFIPNTWRDAKGKTPTHIELNEKSYDIKYLSQWYKLLWLRYLDTNPEIVKFASQYDDFNDIFKGKSINCQADVIRQYIKKGRNSVWNDCSELWDLFKS